LHPFDKGGINHEQLHLRKRYIKCNGCDKSDSLEFYPIFHGENLLDVTNNIIKENDLKTRAKITSIEIDNQIAQYTKNKATSSSAKQKEIYLQRVVNDECFAEAVIIDKIPKFLIANNGTGEISLVDSVSLEKEGKIAYPLSLESYINKPYAFSSQLELDTIIEEAKQQTLDTLYQMVKKIWKKYVDADDFHISICAADTIFTYFQDKAGMTHYLFFVGGPGSGKSNNLEVFHFLAYRNMTSSDITHATLYRFYGGREEGIGTICEDEADNIDEDLNKMRIYKNGYTTGKPAAVFYKLQD
jgi:hypothetical protein